MQKVSLLFDLHLLINLIDKSNTVTHFLATATLRLAPARLLQATGPHEWSCDRRPGINLIAGPMHEKG